jgi:hypothetical protein
MYSDAPPIETRSKKVAAIVMMVVMWVFVLAIAYQNITPASASRSALVQSVVDEGISNPQGMWIQLDNDSPTTCVQRPVIIVLPATPTIATTQDNGGYVNLVYRYEFQSSTAYWMSSCQ